MMRDYSKISPQFWIWARQEDLSSEEMLAALYFLTCPESSPLGVYYFTPATCAHFTDTPLQGVLEILEALSRRGFLKYDPGSSTVWVVNMAAWQFLKEMQPLKSKDNNVKHANKLYRFMVKSPFVAGFYEKYKGLLRLTDPPPEALAKPLQSPCKGVPEIESPPSRSNNNPITVTTQEQEQEHISRHPSGAWKPLRRIESVDDFQILITEDLGWNTQLNEVAKTRLEALLKDGPFSADAVAEAVAATKDESVLPKLRQKFVVGALEVARHRINSGGSKKAAKSTLSAKTQRTANAANNWVLGRRQNAGER